MENTITCDNCKEETVKVITSKLKEDGTFTVKVNKCTNCGFQKSVKSLLKEISHKYKSYEK
jgi:transcriptional regulator NrdR family protein